MLNNKEFEDKVIIITGAASGIGKATAIKFSQLGGIVIIADINASEGNETLTIIKKQGGKGLFIKTDISSDQDCRHLINTVEKHYSKIDILVNNAGIEISGAFDDFTEINFDRLVSINLKSVFLCSKYAIKGMLQRKSGQIINLASVASFTPWPNDAVYSMTKAGVLMLTKAMAMEYASHGIRVNAVAPGMIDTPMTDRALALSSVNLSKAKKMKGQLFPLGRIGTADEVANAILFLSSNYSNFTTGVVLPVDGGYLIK